MHCYRLLLYTVSIGGDKYLHGIILKWLWNAIDKDIIILKSIIDIWLPLFSLMEKAMAIHSSTLAWKIPWTEGPGRLQYMGSLGVGYNWATSLSLFTFMHWRRKWPPTPVFLPGESQGRGAWWAAIYGVSQSWIRLKRLSSSSILFEL